MSVVNLKRLSPRCNTEQQDHIKKMKAWGGGIGQIESGLGFMKDSIILKQCVVNKPSKTIEHCGPTHPQCSESNIIL